MDSKTLADFLVVLLNFDLNWSERAIYIFKGTMERKLSEMNITELAEFIRRMTCLDKTKVRIEVSLGESKLTFFHNESDIQLGLYLLDKFAPVIRDKLVHADERSLEELYNKISELDVRIRQKIRALVNKK